MADALALITSQEQRIKELTEENERLSGAVKQYEEERKYHFEMSRKLNVDTVRKMQERLKAEARTIQDYRGTVVSVVLVKNIDQIAKEMLEGEE
jgi:hypothetical protein